MQSNSSKKMHHKRHQIVCSELGYGRERAVRSGLNKCHADERYHTIKIAAKLPGLLGWWEEVQGTFISFELSADCITFDTCVQGRSAQLSSLLERHMFPIPGARRGPRYSWKRLLAHDVCELKSFLTSCIFFSFYSQNKQTTMKVREKKFLWKELKWWQ